ncbi:hypothetical protein SAMN05421876_10533 [Kaistella jeonii]|uniref:Uncharacterized protein n=1 Tax=Kaistella jeonii TaxID=266749 RepID=A0A0C1FMU6_9FLAO|nr:hypothetical protein OA86_06575 [Kaistella jeonii]SFC01323.1 hypothetical protein SAMN05421876_10533 [Kaistella jeonii]VEI96570.1 Uncharacterised protein [Kaistella jeonii]
MSRTLKIFFIVLGLSIFILPKQMIFAQSKVECCDQKSTKDDCCKTDKTKTCHSENSKSKSEKNNCGDDCTQCHSCSVHFVINFISPESKTFLTQRFYSQKLSFEYRNFYFSSSFQNIWQPPKLV